MNEVIPNETLNRLGSSLLSTSLRFDFMNLLRWMVLAILLESKMSSEKNIKNLFLWILQIDSTLYDRKHQSINLPMRFPHNLHPLKKIMNTLQPTRGFLWCQKNMRHHEIFLAFASPPPLHGLPLG